MPTRMPPSPLKVQSTEGGNYDENKQEIANKEVRRERACHLRNAGAQTAVPDEMDLLNA